MVDIGRTYGALLLGGLFAFAFSGIVTVQAIVYFKVYSEDAVHTRMLVYVVWFLDLLHSAFICTSLIHYCVLWFGQSEMIDVIPWSIAFSVVTTAIQTLIVHCFFARKIHKSSRNNWFITLPILVLAFSRLIAASVSTAEMTRLQRFSAFTQIYPGWVFTTGLSLSAAVDVIITFWLCYFLHTFRRQMGPSLMVHVVDTLMLYTLENGLLTCLVTTASLICWLTMPMNLVFLGLHFVIEKLYANSLLASLNTRQELRDMRTNMRVWSDNNPHHAPEPLLTSEDFSSMRRPQRQSYLSPTKVYVPPGKKRALEVNIRRDVEHIDEDLESLRGHSYGRSRSAANLNRTPTILQWRSPSLNTLSTFYSNTLGRSRDATSSS